MTIISSFPKFEHIYVLDPGGTTGYAKFTVVYNDTGEPAYVCIDEVGEFATWEDLESVISLMNDDSCVVYEGFTLRTLNVHLIPVEVIGVIRFLCTKYRVYHFCQYPHERMAAEKWYNWVSRDFPSHYGSATRHGLTFIVKNLFNNRLAEIRYDYKTLMANKKVR